MDWNVNMVPEHTNIQDGDFQELAELAIKIYDANKEAKPQHHEHKHLVNTIMMLCGQDTLTSPIQGLLCGLVLSAEYPQIASYIMEHIVGTVAYAPGKDIARLVEAVYDARIKDA